MFAALLVLLCVAVDAGMIEPSFVQSIPPGRRRESECVCPDQPKAFGTKAFGTKAFGTKATTFLGSVGVAARLWKVLPKHWRSDVSQKLLSGITHLLPGAILAPLLQHRAWLDFILSIGRTLLYGIAKD